MGSEIKKLETVDNITVSGTVLANLFGVSIRRIRGLENEGIIKKIARGKYSLQQNIKSYINFLKTTSELKENKTVDEHIDYDKEHALLEKTKREKSELELAAMKGTMHYADDVERVMNDMLSNFKSKALSLPARAAPNIAMKEAAEIQDALQEEVLELLHELSNYNPEKFYSEDFVKIDDVDEESK